MGILIATGIVFLWASNLVYSLSMVEVDYRSPFLYFHIVLQTYLFTGLFITGHDAMHRSISSKKMVNKIFGFLTISLYAGMWYPRLVKNHQLHHQFPGTEKDPDFDPNSGNFWIWYFKFMMKYLTVIQLIIMAILFNLLQIAYPVSNIVWFWVVPAVLSTFQLFYFGTYQPHHRPHTDQMQPHNARTLKKNHLWAMLSCYFFGYHYEHHEYPATPWWKLYRFKSLRG
jgi:beta-carotene/zeaxanthin 4-ketolase